jgi:actin related protein 2/3 complex subunit 4
VAAARPWPAATPARAPQLGTQGYDVSFLITEGHLLALEKGRLIEFICAFLEEVDAEINKLKSSVNSRGRAVAAEFLRSMAF